MIKTLVNKTSYEGPKSHNRILAKVRTDVYDTGTGISLRTVSFIVSSFFTKQGIFRNIGGKNILYNNHFGKIYPASKISLKIEQTRIRRIKRKAAIRYLNDRHRNAHVYKKERILKWYMHWARYRESKKLSRIDLETFMRMHSIKFPDYIPISEAAIQGVMYKFNDKGRVVVRRNTKLHVALMLRRQNEERERKALQDKL